MDTSRKSKERLKELVKEYITLIEEIHRTLQEQIYVIPLVGGTFANNVYGARQDLDLVTQESEIIVSRLRDIATLFNSSRKAECVLPT